MKLAREKHGSPAAADAVTAAAVAVAVDTVVAAKVASEEGTNDRK